MKTTTTYQLPYAEAGDNINAYPANVDAPRAIKLDGELRTLSDRVNVTEKNLDAARTATTTATTALNQVAALTPRVTDLETATTGQAGTLEAIAARLPWLLPAVNPQPTFENGSGVINLIDSAALGKIDRITARDSATSGAYLRYSQNGRLTGSIFGNYVYLDLVQNHHYAVSGRFRASAPTTQLTIMGYYTDQSSNRGAAMFSTTKISPAASGAWTEFTIRFQYQNPVDGLARFSVTVLAEELPSPTDYLDLDELRIVDLTPFNGLI